MNKIAIFILSLLLLVSYSCKQSKDVVSFDSFGVKPDTDTNASLGATKLIEHLSARTDTSHITIVFPKGKYDFYEDGAFVREYYISNHDHEDARNVGFAFENLQNITIDGQGSDFIFHGRMIPFALLNNVNITLKNINIDYEVPALRQLKIVEVNKEEGEVFAEIYPHGNYRVQDNKLVIEGEGFEFTPSAAMPFRSDKHLAYNRADVSFAPASVTEISPNLLSIKGWDQVNQTSADERFVLRTYYRPTPGIFVSECVNTAFDNVTVHYAEGMGLIAQMSENITLNNFNVCLRGSDDERFFTTQADAPISI